MLKSKLPLAKQRAQYQHNIIEYQKRKVTPKNIQTIHKWAKKIAEIDKITNRMIAISNAVTIFAGRSPRNVGKNNTRNPDYKMIKLAKSIFYKYGLEQQIWAAHLAEFTRAYRKDEAFRYRTEFTRSFKDRTSDNKQRWYMFKDYIKTLNQDSNSFIDIEK